MAIGDVYSILQGGPEELVGVERFELPTSWSQTRRATRLRYTPSHNLKVVSVSTNPLKWLRIL